MTFVSIATRFKNAAHLEMRDHVKYRLTWNDPEGKYQAADVHRMVVAATPVPVQIDQLQRVDPVPPNEMATQTLPLPRAGCGHD